MKKLLASDIDGTLFVDNDVHEKSIDYIKKFRNNGHVLILCTGRNISGVRALINHYDIEPDGFVLSNGAVILDKNLNIIHSEQIQDDIIKLAFEHLKDNKKYNFYFASEDKIYFIKGHNDNEIMNSEQVIRDWNIIILEEDEFYNNTYFANNMGVEIKSKDINEAQRDIERISLLLKDDVSLYRNQYFIDIAPKKCSKSKGIQKVLEIHGISEDNVYVIGDSWNDLSMFEGYKNSYTFTYAEEELKKHASNIVDSFYDCLEKIID